MTRGCCCSCGAAEEVSFTLAPNMALRRRCCFDCCCCCCCCSKEDEEEDGMRDIRLRRLTSLLLLLLLFFALIRLLFWTAMSKEINSFLTSFSSSSSSLSASSSTKIAEFSLIFLSKASMRLYKAEVVGETGRRGGRGEASIRAKFVVVELSSSSYRKPTSVSSSGNSCAFGGNGKKDVKNVKKKR